MSLEGRLQEQGTSSPATCSMASTSTATAQFQTPYKATSSARTQAVWRPWGPAEMAFISALARPTIRLAAERPLPATSSREMLGMASLFQVSDRMETWCKATTSAPTSTALAPSETREMESGLIRAQPTTPLEWPPGILSRLIQKEWS